MEDDTPQPTTRDLVKAALHKLPAILARTIDQCDDEFADRITRHWGRNDAAGEARKAQNLSIRVAVRDKEGAPQVQLFLSHGERVKIDVGSLTIDAEDMQPELPHIEDDAAEIRDEADTLQFDETA